MARAPVSKTGGWGFESLHSCQAGDPALAGSDKVSCQTRAADCGQRLDSYVT